MGGAEDKSVIMNVISNNNKKKQKKMHVYSLTPILHSRSSISCNLLVFWATILVAIDNVW